ncbi:response regulator [Spirosoma utsteinense]|uniref:CheY-like chemotaxis protein n=1 Tax=Spirosoma utsteinense TaxID=2585773 RepID=A0ABR6W2T0_9BACT|nr:response regulator [Spirosoma utsteinense]MBC3785255.1 CheY-like chemotaxis protein [Spirosoma utsteinense]MBC3790519.1 CheY-like chemotaxis protein [Spirosoma utsteinense]
MNQEPARAIATVYVVDDEADYRFLVQQVFTRFLPHYSVSLFAGGEALLEHMQSTTAHPALILIDIHMPGMSGQQTLLKLKQASHLKSIPVVVMTSSTSALEIQACYEAGANSCLAKPIGLNPLRQRLTLTCDYWIHAHRSMTYV